MTASRLKRWWQARSGQGNRKLLGTLILLGTVFGPAVALAQPFQGCRVGDTPIPSLVRVTIPDAAMAGFTAQGQPAIFLNPAAGSSLSQPFHEFVYWHECAHHVLGHVAAGMVGLSRPKVDEQEADCWAIQFMVNKGLSTMGVSLIQAEAAKVLSQAGDQSHLPAFVRALNLRACLQGGGGSISPNPGCRTITRMQIETRIRTVTRPQVVPCAHPFCNAYGCMPVHPAGDLVMVAVQEPYSVSVPVTTQDCRR